MTSEGQLTFKTKTFPCVLGENGIVSNKSEGDKTTPSGLFSFREIYFRHDRLSRPKTGLKTHAIKPHDGWCDDPNHKDYNRKITLPHSGHNESLWRDDGLYDILAVIGYNDRPIKRALGSAIFLHVAPTGFQNTRGCIAVSLSDLLEIVKDLTPENRIQILPPP